MSEKLTTLIKVLVEKEVKKQLPKIIKEQVSAYVNEALANKFVSSLNEGKSSNLNSLFAEESKKKERQLTEDKKKQRNELLKEMKKKVAGDDPVMNLIYEDINETISTPHAASAASPGMSMSLDSDDDDEGVDISKFGF